MATTKQDLFGWEQNRSEEGSRLKLLYYSKWGGFDVNVIETKKKWKWHQWDCKRKGKKNVLGMAIEYVQKVITRG